MHPRRAVPGQHLAALLQHRPGERVPDQQVHRVPVLRLIASGPADQGAIRLPKTSSPPSPVARLVRADRTRRRRSKPLSFAARPVRSTRGDRVLHRGNVRHPPVAEPSEEQAPRRGAASGRCRRRSRSLSDRRQTRVLPDDLQDRDVAVPAHGEAAESPAPAPARRRSLRPVRPTRGRAGRNSPRNGCRPPPPSSLSARDRACRRGAPGRGHR